MNIRLALVTLILPAIMEISGLVMMLHPPKERNAFFGYRTRRSLLSKETWDFANYYCGTLYVYLGFYVATATLLTDLIIRIIGMGRTGAAAAIVAVVLVQSFCFIFPIFFVESKLKTNFDDLGNLTNPAMDVRPSASYDDSDWNDWKKDEWKEAWRDEYNDWELWKQMKDEEIAAKKRAAADATKEDVKNDHKIGEQENGASVDIEDERIREIAASDIVARAPDHASGTAERCRTSSAEQRKGMEDE